MEEKRKYKRLKDKSVIFLKLPKGAKFADTASSEDISQGGIKISMPSEIVKGDTLDFDINIFHDAITIPVKGRVAWIKETEDEKGEGKKYTVGIEFGAFDSFQKERVIRYVKRKERKA
jgi:c-di-GMP-binding flagellar brake protein YcgR